MTLCRFSGSWGLEGRQYRYFHGLKVRLLHLPQVRVHAKAEALTAVVMKIPVFWYKTQYWRVSEEHYCLWRWGGPKSSPPRRGRQKYPSKRCLPTCQLHHRRVAYYQPEVYHKPNRQYVKRARTEPDGSIFWKRIVRYATTNHWTADTDWLLLTSAVTPNSDVTFLCKPFGIHHTDTFNETSRSTP